MRRPRPCGEPLPPAPACLPPSLCCDVPARLGKGCCNSAPRPPARPRACLPATLEPCSYTRLPDQRPCSPPTLFLLPAASLSISARAAAAATCSASASWRRCVGGGRSGALCNSGGWPLSRAGQSCPSPALTCFPLSDCPHTQQMLDEFGLLRSRTRSYLGRSGRRSSASALPAAAAPATQHPLLARPASAGGSAAAATAATAAAVAPGGGRLEAIYRAALAQVRGWRGWLAADAWAPAGCAMCRELLPLTLVHALQPLCAPQPPQPPPHPHISRAWIRLRLPSCSRPWRRQSTR